MDPINNEFDDIQREHLVQEPAPITPTIPDAVLTDFELEETSFTSTPVAPVASGPSEVDRLTARVAEQQEMINSILAGKPLVAPPAPSAPVPSTPEQAAQDYMAALQRAQAAHQAQSAPAAPVVVPSLYDVSEERFDEILSDPAHFSAYMSEVIEKTRQQAVQEAYGLAMQHLPEAMLPTMYEAANHQYHVQKWAAENPLVVKNKELAATILNQVDGYYPALPLTEKLAMALTNLNTYLGTPAQPTPAPVVAAPAPSPAFARAPRGGMPVIESRDSLQREMDELSL